MRTFEIEIGNLFRLTAANLNFISNKRPVLLHTRATCYGVTIKYKFHGYAGRSYVCRLFCDDTTCVLCMYIIALNIVILYNSLSHCFLLMQICSAKERPNKIRLSKSSCPFSFCYTKKIGQDFLETQ